MSFKASATSKRKENSPQARLPCDPPLKQLCSFSSPHLGSGILTGFPVPQCPDTPSSPEGNESNHRPFQGGFPRGSGPTNPCPSTVHRETYSTSVFCVFTQNNRYYNQDLHQVTDPRRLAPRASFRTLRPPTRLWLCLLPESRRTIGDPLEHRPFSGLVHSAGELLHTP